MTKIILLNNTTSSVLGFRKHLIQYLVKNNYQVYAMATDFNEKTSKAVQGLGAIPVKYTLSRGGLNPFADVKSIRELEKIFNEIKPDIVLSSFVKPAIYGTIAARRANVPKIIAMIEGLGYFFTEQPNGQSLKTKIIKQIQIFLYKIALPKADIVIFLNHDDPKDLVQRYNIPVKRIEVLEGIGLNLSDFPPTTVPINPVSFLWIGRLLKEKGIWEFLKAAEIVKRKYPKVEFKIIGGLDTENHGGIKPQELESFVEKGIVKYFGEVSNVVEYISSSSGSSSSSSYREGSPRSIQEAMAVGRAIIATDIPGSREMIVEGKNGFLVPKWNPEALAERMCIFIENPNLLVEMGAYSRKLAEEKYDGDKVNERLMNIINK